MSLILTNDPILEAITGHSEKVRSLPDYSDSSYADYWCISIKPFKCSSCGRNICFASAGPHLVIIWEERDDDTILQLADLLKKDGNYDPRIERYNHLFGKCIEYEEAEKRGWLEFIE